MKHIVMYLTVFTLCLISQLHAQTVSAGAYGNYCNSASTMQCLEITSMADPKAQMFTAAFSTSKGLSVTFKEGELKPEFKKMLSAGTLTIKGDEQLKEKLCNALNAPKGFTLEQGIYKVVKEGNVYKVDIAGFAVMKYGGK